MAWKIEGQYFENCSCDSPVSVHGVARFRRGPKVMGEGNWRIGVLIDPFSWAA